jgi:hypothetical protein
VVARGMAWHTRPRLRGPSTAATGYVVVIGAAAQE